MRKLEPGHRLSLDLETGDIEIARWWERGLRLRARPTRAATTAPSSRSCSSPRSTSACSRPTCRSACCSAAGSTRARSAPPRSSSGTATSTRSRSASPRAASGASSPTRARSAEQIGSRHHEVVVDRERFLGFLPELVHCHRRAARGPGLGSAALRLRAGARARQGRALGRGRRRGAGRLQPRADRGDARRAGDRARVAPAAAPRSAGAALAPDGPGGVAAAVVAEHGCPGLLRGRRVAHDLGLRREREAPLWRGPAELRPTGELLDSLVPRGPSPHPLDQLQQVYCRSWLVEDLLMKADKMTMRNSLELRVPFLDHALVEWAARRPLEVKVGDAASGWSSKRVLREFAREPACRARSSTRPKRGFPVPGVRLARRAAARLGEGTARARRAARRAVRPRRDSGSTLDRRARGDAGAAARPRLDADRPPRVAGALA